MASADNTGNSDPQVTKIEKLNHMAERKNSRSVTLTLLTEVSGMGSTRGATAMSFGQCSRKRPGAKVPCIGSFWRFNTHSLPRLTDPSSAWFTREKKSRPPFFVAVRALLPDRDALLSRSWTHIALSPPAHILPSAYYSGWTLL